MAEEQEDQVDNPVDPDLAESDRSPLEQFMINQQSAVAKDYYEGRISQEDFNHFREVVKDGLEYQTAILQKGRDEGLEIKNNPSDEYEVELSSVVEEHLPELHELLEEQGPELQTIAATSAAKPDDLEDGWSKDMSLDLLADLSELGINERERYLGEIGPLSHALYDSMGDASLEMAHKMVDARAEMSGTAAQDIAQAREQLETLELNVEAETDERHKDLDALDERDLTELENAKEIVDGWHDHAEHNPGISAEHMPREVKYDHELQEEIDEATGVTDA